MTDKTPGLKVNLMNVMVDFISKSTGKKNVACVKGLISVVKKLTEDGNSEVISLKLKYIILI